MSGGLCEYYSLDDEIRFIDGLGTYCETPKTIEQVVACLRGYVEAVRHKVIPSAIAENKNLLIARAEMRIKKLTQLAGCVPTGRQGVSISFPLSAGP